MTGDPWEVHDVDGGLTLALHRCDPAAPVLTHVKQYQKAEAMKTQEA